MDRRAIAISGIVQGVGFRPYVFGLATRLSLRGFIKNLAGGVLIEVEGEPHSLDRFLSELTSKPPPLSRIDEMRWSSRPPRGDPSFRIEPSEVDAKSPIFISPDVATCDDCLQELFDPRDRRYRYPFLNCTNCGPRLTIITGAPYDRVRTSMARFAMCPACRGIRRPDQPSISRPADRLPVVRPAPRVSGPSGPANRDARPDREGSRSVASGDDRCNQGPGRLSSGLCRRRGRRLGGGDGGDGVTQAETSR